MSLHIIDPEPHTAVSIIVSAQPIGMLNSVKSAFAFVLDFLLKIPCMWLNVVMGMISFI